MNLLAFDNATTTCSVALQCGDQRWVRTSTAPGQQARLILPLIQELLDEAAITLKDLDAIIFGGGPGSFTGIRIACSVAQGLGLATGIPLVRISSLAAMAQSILMADPDTRDVLVAVDARVGQLYWAAYEASSDGLVQLLGEEQVCRPEEVKIPVKSTQRWTAVGDGWEQYPSLLTTLSAHTAITVQTSSIPIATAMLALAMPKINNKEWIAPSDALAVYLR